MKLFAPTAFRYPAITGADYPYGMQDIVDDSLARALLAAGLAVDPITDATVLPIIITAAQQASPTAAMLANVSATYQLNIAPYTRYQSNGTALVTMGGGGGGITTLAAATDFATAALDTGNTPLSNALALKAPLAAPTFTGAVKFTGTLTDQSRTTRAFVSNDTYTIPNGISTVYNSGTGTIYAAINGITLPAAPVDGQTITLENGNSTWYIILLPNSGQTIQDLMTIGGLAPYTSTTYRFNAITSAWIRTITPQVFYSGQTGNVNMWNFASSNAALTYYWNFASWSQVIGSGITMMQGTAGGQGGNVTYLGFQCDNTFPVSSNLSAQGQLGWTGYKNGFYNSLGPYGSGASTAVTSVTTTATLTTSAAYTAVVGQSISVSGVTPSAYNGTYLVTAVSPGVSFSYTFAGGVGAATVQGTWAATNDAQVRTHAIITSKNYSVNQLFSGQPAGLSNYYLWNKFAPLRFACGDPIPAGQGAGLSLEFSNVDATARFFKPICDLTAAKDTGTTSFTVANDVMTQVLAGSGTVLVTFPTSPRSGQKLTLAVRTAYTAITVGTGSGTLIAGAAVGITAGSFATWQYNLADTTWDRVA